MLCSATTGVDTLAVDATCPLFVNLYDNPRASEHIRAAMKKRGGGPPDRPKVADRAFRQVNDDDETVGAATAALATGPLATLPSRAWLLLKTAAAASQAYLTNPATRKAASAWGRRFQETLLSREGKPLSQICALGLRRNAKWDKVC